LPRMTRRAALSTLTAGGTLLAGLRAGQAAAAASGLAKLREAATPQPLPPEFSFTDADGKVLGIGDFAGRGLVVNLWATWCPPCVAEMPALDRMQAALAAEGIGVLALSSDRGGRGAVEPFYQRTGIRHLPIWLDPRGTAARALGVRGLPTSVLVDRSGQERARLEGEAVWDHPEMMAAVRRLCGAGGPAAPRNDQSRA
jgi:thiol-disulfide isomerase/thioredoxin